MNALKASSSSGVIQARVKRVFPSCPVDQILNDEHSDDLCIDDDACSLDDLSIIEGINGREDSAVHMPAEEQVAALDDRESDRPQKTRLSSSNHNEEDSRIKLIQDFFKPFLQKEGKQQPIAVLQSYYSKYQHGLDKQSQQKSVKSWFRYTQLYEDCKSLWWTAELHVPLDVAKQWGFDASDDSPLKVVSGPLPFSYSEWELVESSHSKGRQDVLLELFGVYKKHVDGSGRETIWFKRKGGAQKNCALILLFLIGCRNDNMNVQVKTNGVQVPKNIKSDTPDNVSPRQFPRWVDRLYALGFGRKSTRQFTLNSIKHRAALMDPNGSVLSSGNPCTITCTLTYSDNNSTGDAITVKSRHHFKKEHSFEDVLSDLESSLSVQCDSLSRSSAAEAKEKKCIMTKYDGNIFYEVALPRWSTSEIEQRAFLYELKFSIKSRYIDEENDTNHTSTSVPLSHFYGLTSCTRMGLLSGCDIFEELHNETQELATEFTVPNAIMSDRPVTVGIFNRTSVDISQMRAEIAKMAPDERVDPLSLMKCFNALLFENGGKTYGMSQSKSPEDILSLLRDKYAAKCDRTYCFLPLVSSTSSQGNEDLCIDWMVVLDVLRNVTHPAIQRFNVNPIYYYGLVSVLVAIVTIEWAVCPVSSSRGASGSGRDLLTLIWAPIENCHMKVILGLILITLLSVDKLVPPRRVSAQLLSNRFIKQPVGFGGNLFVLDRRQCNPSLTSSSPLLPADVIAAIPEKLKKAFYDRHNQQLHLATYASYNQTKMKGLCLKYQNECLIKTHHVRCHGDHDFTLSRHQNGDKKKNTIARQNSIAQILATQGYLIPELAQLLPMPRDLLYLSQHASHFMSALERAHSLKVAVNRLSHLRTEVFGLLEFERRNVSLLTVEDGVNKATELGNQNTTAATIREDERLESLGDAVLLFLVVMNLFASCPERKKHVIDWFETEIERHGKNALLSHGALLLGLHRLSFNKSKCVSSWNSAYATISVHNSDSETTSMKRLSNVLESLLGASYLSDSTGAIAVGLLSEMSPCFRREKYKVATGDNAYWFTSKSTCLVAGYQFEKDPVWTSEMDQLNRILQTESTVL